MLEHNLCRIIELYSKVQVDYVAGKISLPKAEMEKKHSQMMLDKSATRSTSRCCGPCNTTISRNSFSTPASRQVGK